MENKKMLVAILIGVILVIILVLVVLFQQGNLLKTTVYPNPYGGYDECIEAGIDPAICAQWFPDEVPTPVPSPTSSIRPGDFPGAGGPPNQVSPNPGLY